MSAGLSSEPRRARRIPVRIPISLIPNPLAGRTLCAAAALDMSELGLRIQSEVALTLGQSVEILLGNRPERCRVAWVGAAGSYRECEAGLEFLDPAAGPHGSS
jgi:hypothetical protein